MDVLSYMNEFMLSFKEVAVTLQCISYGELIGKRATRDIVDARGLLLITEGTILNEKHVEKLRNFNINIFDIRVEDVPAEETNARGNEAAEVAELVKRTENTLSDIDQFIMRNGKVPMSQLEEKMLPDLMQAASKRNVFQLFSALKTISDFRYQKNIGVAALSVKIGKWLGLSEDELNLLTIAACLYDIGSIRLPSQLLFKPDKYQPNEYELMKKHTLMGYRLLKESGVDHRIALVALQHHERLNGSGYPHGLKGDELDALSQIIAVADVYTALTSDRPYRSAHAFEEAVQEIYRGIAHGRYNSRIGQTFLRLLMEAQVGSEIVLSDGSRGKVVLINPNYPTRPLIVVGEKLVDLSKESNLQIIQIFG